MGLESVTVLGAGSWGTALAKLLADKGHPTRLWARREAQAQDIRERRENAAYLPGVELPDTLEPTGDLRAALEGTSMVVSVVPTHGLREVLHQAVRYFPDDAPIVSATKGIENSSLMIVSEIFEEILPKERHRLLTYLSGPSFAKEVAAGMPTAVSVAGRDEEVGTRVQHTFTTDRFRAYFTEDVAGVELGGALKNVVAIAAGIADGIGFGMNTRAALITRGLAEISRLALSRGANPLTMAGLSGMGDLVLTCTGDLSRNRNVGLQLGRGKKLAEILGGMTMVAEGVRTARSVYELAEREDVDMPIAGEVYRVLYEDKPPLDAVVSLMTRPLKHERA
ncbi:MAG: NAD(P)H-dependent glycerol-3-phosphate dehydrogenase [Polyangiales bacterium]